MSVIVAEGAGDLVVCCMQEQDAVARFGGPVFRHYVGVRCNVARGLAAFSCPMATYSSLRWRGCSMVGCVLRGMRPTHV